ncbi:MAG: tetratricopeptide (TPR) repeat protein [Candidatus Latescibacterota bacterium]|jgi:tetratricopeptide (TPR) repeat protein
MTLQDKISRYFPLYCSLLFCIVSWACFADLRHHLLDTHDADMFRDHISISQDWTHFFSADKEQATGRPLAEAVKYAAFLTFGNDPGRFHLLVVAVHTLAAFLLSLHVFRLAQTPLLALASGLLFLLNVTHFQAVHHISALDYPLALCCGLLALRFVPNDTEELSWKNVLKIGIFLALGLSAHLAALAFWPLVLHTFWRRGLLPHRLFVLLAPLGALALACIGMASRQTSTWHSLDLYSLQSIPQLVLGMGHMVSFLSSRLFTTAHWVPLPMHQQQPWELYIGSASIAVLVFLAWRGPRIAAHAAAWTLLTLLPFLLLTETTIQGLPAGPSRYLYLASAGSSLLLAWGLDQLRQRWYPHGAYIAALVGAGVLLSSYTYLKKVEAVSLYTSGRSYIAGGDIENGVRQLRLALVRGPETLPLEETYFRLAAALPYIGQDPMGVLREGLALFPQSSFLNMTLAIHEGESDDHSVRQRGQQRLRQMQQRAEGEGEDELFTFNAASIYHNLASSYMDHGQPARAIKAYTNALAHIPDKANSQRGLSRAHTLLGIELQRQSRNEHAQRAYERAIELNPQNSPAYINWGWLYFEQQQYGQALEKYQTALEIERTSFALFGLGLVYLATEKLEAAQQIYAQAIAEFGSDEGFLIGAADDLIHFIENRENAEIAQRVLNAYWPNYLAKHSGPTRNAHPLF